MKSHTSRYGSVLHARFAHYIISATVTFVLLSSFRFDSVADSDRVCATSDIMNDEKPTKEPSSSTTERCAAERRRSYAAKEKDTVKQVGGIDTTTITTVAATTTRAPLFSKSDVLKVEEADVLDDDHEKFEKGRVDTV